MQQIQLFQANVTSMSHMQIHTKETKKNNMQLRPAPKLISRYEVDDFQLITL